MSLKNDSIGILVVAILLIAFYITKNLSDKEVPQPETTEIQIKQE